MTQPGILLFELRVAIWSWALEEILVNITRATLWCVTLRTTLPGATACEVQNSTVGLIYVQKLKNNQSHRVHDMCILLGKLNLIAQINPQAATDNESSFEVA